MTSLKIVTAHYTPENTACTNRMYSFVETLKNDFDVQVYSLTEVGCPITSYGHEMSNIPIEYIEQKSYSKKNFFKRALFELYYCCKLVVLARKKNTDLILVTIPYMFFIPLVYLFLPGKKILDIRDLVWVYLDDKKIISSIIKKTLSMVFKFFIKKYDIIVVTNESEFQEIVSYKPKGEVILVPNGISLDRYQKLSTLNFVDSDKKRVLYVGNVGLAQNLNDLINIAKFFPNVEFDIVGDGSDLNRLSEMVLRLGINNVNFHGKVTWDKLADFYSKASLLFAGLSSEYKTAMPSKIYEYGAVGLPILFSGNGVASTFVSNLSNSFSFEPGKIESSFDYLSVIFSQNICISMSNRELIFNNFVRDNSNSVLLGSLKQV